MPPRGDGKAKGQVFIQRKPSHAYSRPAGDTSSRDGVAENHLCRKLTGLQTMRPPSAPWTGVAAGAGSDGRGTPTRGLVCLYFDDEHWEWSPEASEYTA